VVKLVLLCIASLLFAKNGMEIAHIYGLNAVAKASKQWERIFSDSQKMNLLKINQLSPTEKKLLKEYLMANAADSDRATLPGR
jgi:hypothetical protein